MKRVPAFLLVVVVILAAISELNAYKLLGYKWLVPSITMQLQLVKPASALHLIDGSGTFNNSAAAALSHWNPRMKSFKFSRVLNSNAAKGPLNSRNNVFFANKVYTIYNFGANTLAVCVTWATVAGNPRRAVESDVVFNTKWRWNSYRGAPRSPSNPGYDFRRVAIHEFGHALGLAHSNAVAIMRPIYGSIFAAQVDDINGAQRLYGKP